MAKEYKARIADSLLRDKLAGAVTGRYAFRREDGVLVVPAGCLKD